MKNWGEYFNKEQKEQVNEEHHVHTKEERISWICETLEKLSDEEVEKIYLFIEDTLGVE